ncbi:MAG: LysM peptidoglycan-binding domain-containing protein [Alistipes ihumii]
MKKTAWLLLCILLGFSWARAQTRKSESMVTIAGESYYVHTVEPGETLYSLGKAYGTDEQAIRRNNPHTAEGLKTGQVLKIPVVRQEPQKPLSERKKKRLFEIHTVNQGETAYSISKRYGVGLDVLMEDNEGFDPTHLSIGQQINIRKSSVGSSDHAEIKEQIESYKDALNSVSDRFTHHMVARGETLYSLGKRYGLPVDSIVRYNEANLRDGLKVGSILRIPVAPQSGYPSESDPHAGIPDRTVFPTDTPPLPDATAGNLPVKRFDANAPVRVAMLLPLQADGIPNRQFLEFYQGALLALSDLKGNGVSARLDLFDTGRSVTETQTLLQRPELREADLIVGPVYDETFTPVADFAARYGIPAVSSLGAIESADHSLLFKRLPMRHRSTTTRGLFSDTNNVVVISAAQNDTSSKQEILPLLPGTAHRRTTPRVWEEARWKTSERRQGERDRRAVIGRNDDRRILAYVSSIQNSLIARSVLNPSIRVVGSSRWARFRNIEKNLFFKLNLRYVTSYHADRGNQRVLNFDRRYIADFGSIPSLYAYRGYDVTKLFVGTVKLHGSDFVRYLNEAELPLLQTPYRFVQKAPGRKFENSEWALVCYNNNYTIEVR